MEQVKKDEALRILSPAEPEWKAFWFRNGLVAKSLPQLAEALLVLDEDTFQHHVSESKNDLAKWVEEVIGDTVLAKRLETALCLNEAINAVLERIVELAALEDSGGEVACQEESDSVAEETEMVRC